MVAGNLNPTLLEPPMAKNSVHKLVDSQSMPITIARQYAIANAAGGGNGQAVSTAVSFTDRFGNGLLPVTNYVVSVTPSQACWTTITNKTPFGFNVVLNPASTVTLAAGTFDVTVIA
jgi:hypothetical protein